MCLGEQEYLKTNWKTNYITGGASLLEYIKCMRLTLPRENN